MDHSGTTAPAPPLLAALLLRERVLLLGALGLVVGLSWAYLLRMSASMDAGAAGALFYCGPVYGPAVASPGEPHRLWPFAMWAVMAVAMMLPTALPLVLLFGRFWRGRYPARGVGGPVLQLVLGYLLAWLAFAVAASALQVWLEQRGLLDPGAGELRSAAIGGATLVAAGLFQLTPLKAACLSRCRSPLMFLMTRWRAGRWGSLLMGIDHGVFCLGCCWALMLVMFVAGVMNLLWMAALTVVMSLEKIVRRGDLLARGAGAALVAAGLWMMAR